MLPLAGAAAAALVRAADKMAVSDDALTDMVRRKLANDPDVKGGTLQVAVKNGEVTLSGGVKQERLRQKAEKLARKVRGVRHVVNNIKVEQ